MNSDFFLLAGTRCQKQIPIKRYIMVTSYCNLKVFRDVVE